MLRACLPRAGRGTQVRDNSCQTVVVALDENLVISSVTAETESVQLGAKQSHGVELPATARSRGNRAQNDQFVDPGFGTPNLAWAP